MSAPTPPAPAPAPPAPAPAVAAPTPPPFDAMPPVNIDRDKPTNPAIKPPKAPKAPAPETTVETIQLNEDGFVPGEEVDSKKVLAWEKARLAKERAAK